MEYLRSFSLNLTYNIIGDWKDIPHGSLLIDYLGQMSYSNYIQCSYTHIPLLESSLKKNFSYQVYVSLPVDHSLMNNTCIFLDQQKIPFQYIFQVTSLEDCNEAVTLIEKYDIDKYQLRPLYTKDNISFLAKNTFLTEEDILSTKISMKDIFRKHIINKDNFGKLFILSNGDIYANILHKKLGNIKTDSIYQIVKKEIEIGESWLRIRNQKPCCDCLYQYICPSPSDLDLMIGQLNLCTVNNK
ncbi:TIGR04150 pseudo-rSAM protein [Parabacteroides distasonis]|uniref:TIGR04150 pseudo-rSAM protein n=2 Tax=Parabacteroides distasonis TaxID=823 RepID=UPI00321B70DF